MKAWRRLSPAKQKLAVAVVALVGYLLVLFVWGSTAPKSDSQIGPIYSKGQELDSSANWLIAVAGGVMVVGAVLLLFTIIALLQARGPRFKDLDRTEQERRREAGRLLKGDTGST